MSNCRSCKAEIVWVKTPAGKPMPLDPEYLSVVTDEGEVVRGRLSHFATCPQAESWRKGRDG